MKADDLLLFTERDEKGEPMGFKSGLTVRDYIAIQCMSQLASKEGDTFEQDAEASYRAADALIAESEKK